MKMLSKVSNFDTFLRSIKFYFNEQPQLLNEMLISWSNKLDLSKTVMELRKTNYLFLFEQFLKEVQKANLNAVNDALN